MAVNVIEVTLAPLCKICERVPFGDIVRLGNGSWRHDGCGFGSTEWLAYYERMPEGKGKENLTDLARCLIGPVETMVITDGEDVSNNSTEGA